MTDLINNVNALSDDAINILMDKYHDVLNTLHEHERKLMAYVIDVSVKYMNDKYSELSPLIKTWSVVGIRRLVNDNKINSDDDLKLYIDKLIDEWNGNYDNFVKNNHNFKNDYLRDREFLNQILEKMQH